MFDQMDYQSMGIEIADEYPAVPQAFDANSLLRYLFQNQSGGRNVPSEEELLEKISFSFNAEPVGDGGSSSIIKAFLDKGVSRSEVLALFCAVKEKAPLNPKTVEHPYMYLRKAVLPELKEVKENEKDPRRKVFLIQEEINKYFVKMAKLDSDDFVRSLLYSSGYGDISFENLMFKPVIERHKDEYENNQKNMLIVDPTPDFMKECIVGSEPYGIHSMFLDESLYGIFSKQYKNGRFIKYSLETERNKNISFDVEFEDNVYDNVIMFGHRDPDVVKSFIKRLEKQTSDNAPITLLIPNTWIDSDFKFRRLLCECLKIDCISIMPTAVYTGEPKKHVLISAHKGRSSEYDDIYLKRIHFKASGSDKKRAVSGNVFGEPWKIRVSVNDFLGISEYGETTINALFENRRPNTEKVCRSSHQLNISKELTIWYSWKNGRGRYTYYSILREKKKEGKQLDRGTPLFSKQLTAKTEDIAIKNIKKNIMQGGGKDAKKLFELISSEISEKYLNDSENDIPISLLSYWLCRRETIQENAKSNYNAALCIKIFGSDYISNIMSGDAIKADKVMAEIKRVINCKTKNDIHKCLRQINLILREAATENRFNNQDITVYLKNLDVRDKGYSAARASLTKKNYIAREEEAIVDFLCKTLRKTKRLEYLGALICFFTGCSNREAAALLCKDDVSLAGLSSQRQLLIYREFDSASGTPHKIELKAGNVERYRKIPIVSELNELINEFVSLNEKDGEDSKIGNPLLYHEENGKKTFVFPEEIRRAKVEAEKKLNLVEKAGFVSELDKESDFNKYSGDRFRTNFEYRLTQTCMMSMAEVNYLLGRQQINTFSKHYCDYSNDFSQIMLKNKMERWSSAFADIIGNDNCRQDRTEGVFVKEHTIRESKKVIPQRTVARTTTNLTVTVNSDQEKKSKSKVIVQDSRGLDIDIDVMEKR